MRTTYRLAAMAMAVLATPAAGRDFAFTPEAAATWSARTRLMAKVIDDAADHMLTRQSFAIACDGLRGEMMKFEYQKAPEWAVYAQVNICVGFDGLAGKFASTSKPCIFLKKGLEYLDHAADPGVPAEVASAAGELRPALDLIMQVALAHNKKACTK